MDRKAVHFCYVVKLSYLYFTDGVITIRMGPASGIEMGLSAPAMNHRAGEGYIFLFLLIIVLKQRFF